MRVFQSDNIVPILVAGLIVISTIPIPVAGQDVPESRVLLDTDREQIDSVSLDGETYQVYRYENLLPYASGIEVYSNGERITSESDANRVLRVIAWERATEQLGPEEIDTLRSIHQSAQEIQQLVSGPISALNTILGFIDWMKETSVAGFNVWEEAKNVVPALEGFDTAARDLRAELEEWRNAAQAVNENLPPVINALERIKRGEEVDYSKLSQQFADSMSAMERLQSKSDELERRLSDMSQRSDEIATATASIPVVGGDISDAFTRLSNEISSAASRVDQYSSELSEQESNLRDVKQTAESERNTMMRQWQSRQNAQLKVYGTLAVLSLPVVAGLFYVFRRRRRYNYSRNISPRISSPLAFFSNFSIFNSSLGTPSKRPGPKMDNTDRPVRTEQQGKQNLSTKTIKIPYFDKSFYLDEVIGIGLAISAIFLLTYTTGTIRNMLRYGQGLEIKQSLVIQLIFLFLVVSLAGYLINKAVELGRNEEKIGLLLLPTGAIILISVFRISNSFTPYLLDFGMHFVIRIFIILGLAIVGVFFLNSGIKLIDKPNLTGFSLSGIGVIMLLFSVYRANQVIVTNPSSDRLLLNLTNLIIMIAIAGFLVSKGVLAIQRKENEMASKQEAKSATAESSQAIVCSECGQAVPKDAEYCNGCGTKLTELDS